MPTEGPACDGEASGFGSPRAPRQEHSVRCHLGRFCSPDGTVNADRLETGVRPDCQKPEC